MEEKIKQVLMNHKQASLTGIHQITGGDIQEIRDVLERLEEEGWLKKGTSLWDGGVHVVYRRVPQKPHELF